MNRTFDLGAAKKGATIQHKLGGKWDDVYFVGTTRAGEVVVQFGNGCISIKNEKELRMKPAKRTVWVNLHRQHNDNTIVPFLYEDGEHAKKMMMSSGNCIGSYPMEFEE